jgi:hypothetical protein
MRLQLRTALAAALALGFFLRQGAAWAQSAVKVKRLRYVESTPGITVDEEVLEVLLTSEDETQYSGLFIHDTITGASPTGIPAAHAITGASSSVQKGRGQNFAPAPDDRWATSLGYAPLLTRTTRLNTALHYSTELDYRSLGATAGLTFELNKKNTTIAPSVTAYRDRVIPATGTPGGNKDSEVYSLVMSQVLGPRDIVSFALGALNSRGHLTDPYKQVLVGASPMPESRPAHRSGRYAQMGWRTQPWERHALDGKVRYYDDDWGVTSVTLNGAVLSQLGESWLLELFGRYYEQQAARFWAASFAAGDTSSYRTADLRLAAFIAITAGITATYKLSDAWWLEGSYARYSQRTGGSGDTANPAAPTPLPAPRVAWGAGVGNEPYMTAQIFSAAVQFRF